MSIVTTFESQCRALASTISPDENATRYLVGTLSPSAIDNYIYLFEYKDDNSSLAKIAFKFPHGEIWHLGTSMKQPDLLSVVSGYQGKYKISLFKLPPGLDEPIEDDYGLSEAPIEKVYDIIVDGDASKLTTQSHWHPDGADRLLTCNKGLLETWDIVEQKKTQSFNVEKTMKNSNPEDRYLEQTARIPRVADLKWSSLFNCSVVAAAIDNSVCGFDTRVPDSSPSSICWWIEDRHCNKIRSLDFNPNSQYHVATGGDDCRANFWDLRRTHEPALHFQAHTHWIWSIRYNPFHDQLVLSGGSDGRAILMRAQTISSEAYEQSQDEEKDDEFDENGESKANEEGHKSDESADEDKAFTENARSKHVAPSLEKTSIRSTDYSDTITTTASDCHSNGVIKSYDEHDDSVYAAEWATDPWIFATLGFESRLIINKVPKAEKFNILFRGMIDNSSEEFFKIIQFRDHFAHADMLQLTSPLVALANKNITCRACATLRISLVILKIYVQFPSEIWAPVVVAI